jgi:hypothetical protein
VKETITRSEFSPAPPSAATERGIDWKLYATSYEIEFSKFVYPDGSKVINLGDCAILIGLQIDALQKELAAVRATGHHEQLGLNLFRQLVCHGNALIQLVVFSCNVAYHNDDCKCFWEQCEAWAKADSTADSDSVGHHEVWQRAIEIVKATVASDGHPWAIAAIKDAIVALETERDLPAPPERKEEKQ